MWHLVVCLLTWFYADRWNQIFWSTSRGSDFSFISSWNRTPVLFQHEFSDMSGFTSTGERDPLYSKALRYYIFICNAALNDEEGEFLLSPVEGLLRSVLKVTKWFTMISDVFAQARCGVTRVRAIGKGTGWGKGKVRGLRGGKGLGQEARGKQKSQRMPEKSIRNCITMKNLNERTNAQTDQQIKHRQTDI